MSGLYLSTGAIDFAEVASKRLAFTADTSLLTGNAASISWAVTRVDAMDLWGPAVDRESGVCILLGGRVAFDEAEWRKAEATPYSGGLACRRLLDLWINRPATFTEELNGAFVVAIIEPRNQLLHIFTDRLGVYPIYQAPDEAVAVCSHTDVLADDLVARGRSCDIDWTTIAECLGTASSVQPHTYYRQISQLEPGTHYVWKLGLEPRLIKVSAYWQPAYLTIEPINDPDALAELLAGALKKAAQRRTLPRLGKAAVMLSGGADSRAALFGAHTPSDLTCFTLFDEVNPELETAQRLAKLAGSRHVLLKRDLEYYPSIVEESVRISGGMWSVVDSHYLGSLKRISAENVGSLLTGCYADYLFKGLSLNRKHKKLFDRNLPLFDLASFDYAFYHGHTALSQGWQSKVLNRLQGRFPELYRRQYQSNALPVESLRLRPLSREADAMGRLVLWRTLPWDPFLTDNEILKVYEILPIKFKLNGQVFGNAVGHVIGKSGRKIFNSNYGTPIDATETQKAAWFIWAVMKRKVGGLVDGNLKEFKLATSGSWPNWPYVVAKSKKLKDLWEATSKEERLMFEVILGYDPWSIPLEEWSFKDCLLFSRVLTLGVWLRHRGIMKNVPNWGA